MSDTATAEAVEPDEEQSAAVSGSRPSSVWAIVVYVLFLVVLIAGQIFIWNFWEPAFGDSLKNLITYSMGILFLLGSAAWALVLLPSSWKVRLLVAGLFVSPLAVVAAVVRDVEWSGDMKLTLHYRWDDPDSATLRASAPAPEKQEVSSALQVTPTDYAEYRGPLRDGVILSNGADFTAEPTEVWRRDVGAGWAGMAVVGDVLITLEQIGSEEAVVCYDATSGDELWRLTYAASFDEAMGGPGPRSTPTVTDGRVYTYGALGHLSCVDLVTGDLVWQVDTLGEFGVNNVTWATSGSPLVRDGRLYINTGSNADGGLTCFDVVSGDVLWRASKPEWDVNGPEAKNAAGYASPMFATLSGVEQIVMLDGMALRGHALDDGHELWSHPFKNGSLVNVAQPLVFEDGRIFIAASYDSGCEMVQVSVADESWDVTSLWKDRRLMRCKFTSPVLFEGHIYGLNEGILECVDAGTGKRLWKKGRYGHGQVLLSDGLLVVMTEHGQLAIVRATPESFDVVSETDYFTDAARNWNPHSLSAGRVFIRNHEEMARVDFPVDMHRENETAVSAVIDQDGPTAGVATEQ